MDTEVYGVEVSERWANAKDYSKICSELWYIQDDKTLFTWPR